MRPRVVIAGAGFGGLTCARALRRAPVDVLLVDANNYHLFTPLLYQVASALLDPAEIAHPVRALIRPLRNADFRLARIEAVDLDGRRLLTDHGDIPYDYLVLATGSTSNYFGNRDLEERAFGLKELPEAIALRNRVLAQFERSRWQDDHRRRRATLSFAVVGGGPTGVEFAGALSELIRLVLRRDYRGLDLSEVRVILLEAADDLLASFVPSLREEAVRALRGKGVEVRLGAAVKSVSAGAVELNDGERLEAETVIWTAGVRARDLAGSVAAAAGARIGQQGRIKVGSTLQLEGHPEVFVVGDMAALEQGGAELPMLIPVAMQEAKRAARSIAALTVEGGEAGAFEYRDPGFMATIGRNAAVAQLGRVHLSGFLGWGMWLVVHLINIVSFRSRLIVLLNWAWEYFFYDRPVRLLVRAALTPPVDGSGSPDGGGSAPPAREG